VCYVFEEAESNCALVRVSSKHSEAEANHPQGVCEECEEQFSAVRREMFIAWKQKYSSSSFRSDMKNIPLLKELSFS
jgi:hypothetical protein